MIQSVLDRQDEFLSRQQNKMDALVDKFLADIGDDIHYMLCNLKSSDKYHGLNSN